MPYLFTSESVAEGHPDKVADQISDAILDEFLRQDPNSKVACETLVTTGLVVVAGEVRSEAYVDIQETARRAIERIGYTKPDYQFEAKGCGVISAIHEQSPDIAQGVDVGKSENEQGAGDQGMMFGYATNETDNYMPLALDLAHRILRELADIRHTGKQMKYLRPDAKSQVTIEYSDKHVPKRIDTIVVSTQHDPEATQERIAQDIQKIV
ncbi:MAG: methionine adenosyltransferase, partial [Saprospiraceae bacterium]|nr:methionine adenosyltransferase [Saprospiraceae bacterium]